MKNNRDQSDLPNRGGTVLTDGSGKKIRLNISAASHPGNVRDNNEDSFSVNGNAYRAQAGIVCIEQELEPSSALLAVCDGMGGEADGDLASDIAIKGTQKLFSALTGCEESQIAQQVDGYIAEMNLKICRALNNSDAHRGGSTVALAYIRKNKVYPFWLGDSRIYLYDGSELVCISKDHTLAMRKYRAGIYSLEEAGTSPDRHKLTLFLGVDFESRGLSAETCEPIELKCGQKLLICSDGLYDMCSDAQIKEALASDSGGCSQRLVDLALAGGGADNVTCIVLTV